MKKILSILIGCLVLTPMAHGASFDCAKAHAAMFDAAKAKALGEKNAYIQRIICGNGELSKLDDQMAAAYKLALEVKSKIEATRQAQQEWLKRRNDCADFMPTGPVTECVQTAYEERLKMLPTPPLLPEKKRIKQPRYQVTQGKGWSGKDFVEGNSGGDAIFGETEDDRLFGENYAETGDLIIEGETAPNIMRNASCIMYHSSWKLRRAA